MSPSLRRAVEVSSYLPADAGVESQHRGGPGAVPFEGDDRVVEHTKGRSHGDAAWRRVEDALRDLADAIGRAGRTPVEEDEQRRRMEELACGLASLADGIRGSAPQPQALRESPAPADEPPSEHVVPPAEACPQAFNAVMSAKEKFREAAERFEHPQPVVSQATPFPPLAPGSTVPAAVVSVPEPSVVARSTADPAAAGSEESGKVSSLDRLNAIRAAHERFVAERRAAEEAATTSAPVAAREDDAVPER